MFSSTFLFRLNAQTENIREEKNHQPKILSKKKLLNLRKPSVSARNFQKSYSFDFAFTRTASCILFRNVLSNIFYDISPNIKMFSEKVGACL